MKRRSFLPFLSGAFLMSLFGFQSKAKPVEGDEIKTVLTKDGRAVRVRSSVINDSKVLNNKMSNQNLLSWLKKDNLNPWSR